jgi:hypothetical protein
MVALVADVHADVVQQRAELEPFPLSIAEAVHAPRLVENAQRQTGHLLRMLGPVPAPFAELDDAAATDVRVSLDLTNSRAVAVNVIEHEALAKREVAQGELIGVQTADDRVEQHGTSDREVGAPRIHARDPQPLSDVGCDEAFPQPMEGFCRYASVAQILRTFARIARRQCAQAEDRPGSPDDAVEPSANDLVEISGHLAREMLQQPPFVAFGERVGLHEPLRQPDDAKLEAPSDRQMCCRSEGHFHAAAADVDNHGRVAADIDAVPGGEVNEPGLLRPGNDANSDPRLPFHLGNEIAAILGFACSAGGCRNDFIDFVGICEPLELCQRLQRRCNGGGRQLPAVEAASPEADHILFAINDFERQVGTDLNYDHVDGVGSDVDGGNAHAGASVRSSRGPIAVVRYMYT